MPKGGEREGGREGGAHIFLEFGVRARAHRRMWEHYKGRERSVSDADAG